ADVNSFFKPKPAHSLAGRWSVLRHAPWRRQRRTSFQEPAPRRVQPEHGASVPCARGLPERKGRIEWVASIVQMWQGAARPSHGDLGHADRAAPERGAIKVLTHTGTPRPWGAGRRSQATDLVPATASPR